MWCRHAFSVPYFFSQKNEWREIAVSKASDLQEWSDISRLALHALSHQGPNTCSIQNTNLALLLILGRMLPASHYHPFPVAENARIGVRYIWIQILPPPLTSCMFWRKFLLHFSLFFSTFLSSVWQRLLAVFLLFTELLSFHLPYGCPVRDHISFPSVQLTVASRLDSGHWEENRSEAEAGHLKFTLPPKMVLLSLFLPF